MANVRRRTWFRSAGSNDHAVFDDEANSHHQWLSEEGFIEQPDNIEYSKEFMYPNATLKPHLTRKHVTLIALSGTIGTGLFLGSGAALINASPLGILLGYFVMSTVVYGMVVSIGEMVAVYPYCRGTVALADRFVDPALGFAMGWNAWFHWGIVIPSQIAAATALIKYWNPPEAFVWFSPTIFILFTTISVFGIKFYGKMESTFALVKLYVIALLICMALIFDFTEVAHKSSPFQFWDPLITQFLDIPGAGGRFLAFFSVFAQALFSFGGIEIPAVLAGELKDAPRVIYPVLKRGWIRITIIYMVALLLAGTLVSSKTLESQMESPPNDAPWSSSPFITALIQAGVRFSWISHVVVACFILSAASAASAEVFINARTLYYLAKAGHAPKIFGSVWPNPDTQKDTPDNKRSVVPWAGVIATVGFAGLSWLCVRPTTNTISAREKAFLQLASMAAASCLQAWMGMLFTYIRFWRGTCHPENQRKYKDQIARIKENRAWGQPLWAIWSLTVFILVFLFNGWSLFNRKNATWVIFWKGDPATFDRYHVAQFITTTVPIPLLMLVVFGYKLICQTTMIRAKDMNFSGVAGMDVRSTTPVEEQPTDFWGRIWWILVK